MNNLNEQNIREIVREEIQKNYRAGDPKIPPHKHNGTDNLQIRQNDVIQNVKGNGTITMSQSTTYELKLGKYDVFPTSVTFYGGALNTVSGLHAMIVGNAQLGNNQQFQPESSTSVVLGPVVTTIIQGSAAMISTNVGTSIIKNSQGHIVYAADASNNNYATATVTAYDDSKITIETSLAANWSISGLWIIT